MLSRFFFLWEQSLSRRDTNRKVREFEWGVEFVPNGIPQKDPRLCLLEFSRRALAESDAYHSHEKVRDWKLRGNHLTFTSPLRTRYPRNNTVHGRYFPTDSDGRVVLVLPQWNCDAQGHMSLCRMLNLFGLSALRLSLPYHDLRMPDELVGLITCCRRISAGRSRLCARLSLIAKRRWIGSKDRDTGSSQFRDQHRLVCGADHGGATNGRRCTYRTISPHTSLTWSGEGYPHGMSGGTRGKDYTEDLRKIWLPISPKPYFKKLKGTNKQALLVHALYDYSFPPDLRRSGARFQGSRTAAFHLALRCGHYTSGVFPFNVVLGYAMCGISDRHSETRLFGRNAVKQIGFGVKSMGSLTAARWYSSFKPKRRMDFSNRSMSGA